VRHEDDGVRVALEVFLEPVACVEIEMVRRLVEQQQVGTPEQELGERDAHLPAAGEGFAWALGVFAAEPETAQHRRDAQVHAVALVEPKTILQLAVARQHRVVFRLGHRRIGQAMLDVVHLGLNVEQGLKRAAGFPEDRAALSA
jgi:hypothetical protein